MKANRLTAVGTGAIHCVSTDTKTMYSRGAPRLNIKPET